jgi:hypothetical protein
MASSKIVDSAEHADLAVGGLFFGLIGLGIAGVYCFYEGIGKTGGHIANVTELLIGLGSWLAAIVTCLITYAISSRH